MAAGRIPSDQSSLGSPVRVIVVLLFATLMPVSRSRSASHAPFTGKTRAKAILMRAPEHSGIHSCSLGLCFSSESSHDRFLEFSSVFPFFSFLSLVSLLGVASVSVTSSLHVSSNCGPLFLSQFSWLISCLSLKGFDFAFCVPCGSVLGLSWMVRGNGLKLGPT